MTNFGGYKIFRPRLTKYCRGCVPGVSVVVDAHGVGTAVWNGQFQCRPRCD